MRDAVTAARPLALAAPAALIAAASLAVLAAVWTLQARGYTPCELCLKERIPFYLALMPAAALAVTGPRLPAPLSRLAFALLAALFAAGTALGTYHAGVEWHLWAGPTGCSGAAAAPPGVDDFLKQLQAVSVVRCDEAALRVAGLSLAAWNAVVSAGLAAVAALGWRRAGAR